MRTGLITYGLDRPLTGIGRYTLELARALAALEEDVKVTLLTAGGPGPLVDVGSLRHLRLPGCRLLPGLMTLGNAWIPRCARQLGLDLVHDPTGATPFLFGAGGAGIVVTVHDVFAWSCTGHSALLDVLIYRHWLPRVLPRRASAVITVSELSRGDILQYLGVDASHLHVIPYGVSPCFRPLPPEKARRHVQQGFELYDRYVLYVGALTLRKNIERALSAFARVAPDFPLHKFVLAGPRAWKQTPIEDTVQELGIADRIVMTGPLTDADLPALYSGASLFVFPSLYEGFGLPPLEAMACGTPVVCSNAASLPEVVGDAAITVDPYDVDGLAAAMHRALTDADLREELRARGLERAKQFTWERTAQETVSVYRKVLDLAQQRRMPVV